MTDPYQILGVQRGATSAEIKKAFRERAKQVHPDITLSDNNERMRMVIFAYKTLSAIEAQLRRDNQYRRPAVQPFDFRAFLLEKAEEGEGEARARLILFELFHLRGRSAIDFWHKFGGLNFPLDKYFEHGEWMDIAYTLAEELANHAYYYEAFLLLVDLIKAETAKPYFRHFADEVKRFLKELVRLKLRTAVDDSTWIVCLQKMLTLDYPLYEQVRWRAALKRFSAKGHHETASGSL
jgi:curved DNA-binding protein CbpA